LTKGKSLSQGAGGVEKLFPEVLLIIYMKKSENQTIVELMMATLAN
jgi:selenophosphate synthase